MKFKLSIVITVLLLTLTACNGNNNNPDDQPKELSTEITDALEMDFTYEGKSYLTDGAGEVTLVRCTDGDTATFEDGTRSFAVRFLGIDTPESTYRIDPWGKTASEYTCNKLTNASTIVLEAGDQLQDNYERYLAWVWYDGKLLNVELVEQALSGSKGASELKYGDTLYDAELAAQATKKRIWGENDPNYDYSLDGVQVTPGELATNLNEYIGRKIVITGVIAVEVDGSPYIVDDSGYGIYLYLRENSYKIEPGNKVRIQGLDITFYPDKETGSPQLVGVTKRNIELLSENNVITPRVVEVANITNMDLGSYAKVENITVKNIYVSDNTGDYTITCEDHLGNTIGLHISNIVDETVVRSLLSVGSVIDVAGGLSRYNEQYQLEMSDLDSVVKK